MVLFAFFLGAYIEAKGAGHRCVSSVMVSGNLSFSQMIYIGELGRWIGLRLCWVELEILLCNPIWNQVFAFFVLITINNSYAHT